MISSKPHSKPVGRLDLNVAWSHAIARLLTMEKVQREEKMENKVWEGEGEMPACQEMFQMPLVTSFEICNKART